MRLLLLIFLAACSPHHSERDKYSLPPELQNCKVFLISDGAKDLYVMKCPNEQTTTAWTVRCGKNCLKTEHTILVHSND